MNVSATSSLLEGLTDALPQVSGLRGFRSKRLGTIAEEIAQAAADSLTLQHITPETSRQDTLEAYARKGPASSVMSGNFAGNSNGPSRYLQAAQESYKINTEVKLALETDLYEILDDAGGLNPSGTTYGSNEMTEAEARAIVKRRADKRFHEATERNRKELKEDIENRTEAAIAEATGSPPPAEAPAGTVDAAAAPTLGTGGAVDTGTSLPTAPADSGGTASHSSPETDAAPAIYTAGAGVARLAARGTARPSISIQV